MPRLEPTPPESRHPEPCPEVIILADDLTGACDTAQPFAGALPTGVLVRQLEGLEGAAAWRALSVNARTRSVSPNAARDVTRKILSHLAGRVPSAGAGPAVIYKKIDSTLRGNVAAEVEAVADVFPGRPVIVAPAFPAMGRTTVEGRVCVRGVPVDRTEYATDPRHPVRDASVVRLLGGGESGAATAIPLALVRAGPSALSAALVAACRRGRFLCLDAERDEDLDAIARAVEPLDPPRVLVGSAGLASALARTWRRQGGGPRDEGAAASCGGPTLAVIGTRNPATVRQVEWVRRQGLVPTFAITPGQFLGARGGLQSCLLRVHLRAALEARQDAVLHVNGDFVPEFSVSRVLAGLVEGLPRAAFRGLVLSGGGTADAVLHRLGAWGISLSHSPIPAGCSLGALRGGAHENSRIVLKAGGFGEATLLAHLLSLRSPC